MTQTPRPLFGGHINIPEDEKFNPNRPSLDAACYGNRTMGNILNYFLQRAVHEVEWQKLGKDCKVVTFSIKDREKILQELRVSEKTYITYMAEFNTLEYIHSQPYSKEYTVSFEATNKGIAHPPAPKHRGRPRKTTESCSNLPQENTSTSRKNTSTYVRELETKVEAISEELKVLQEERKVLQLFQKDLQQIWKVLQLSESHQDALAQVLSTNFQAPKILQTLPDIEEEYSDVGTSHTLISSLSENTSHSHVTADTRTETANVLNEAGDEVASVTSYSQMQGYKPNENVTQPQESEPTYGHTTSVAPDLPGGTHWGTVSAQHPVSVPVGDAQDVSQQALVESEETHDEATQHLTHTSTQFLPHGTADLEYQSLARASDANALGIADRASQRTLHSDPAGTFQVGAGLESPGYEKGEPHAPLATTGELPGVSDADRGDRVHLSMLPVGRTDVPDTQEVTPATVASMPTPLGVRQPAPVQFDPPTDGQGTRDGDARESDVTPPSAALVRSHTSFYDIDLDLLAEDTWVVIPGRTTEMIPGEGIRTSADTSLDATSQSTETPVEKPASSNKTVPQVGNKKPRGKSEAQPEPLLESPLVEPDMHGIWNHEKVVQYTEWCLGERYRDTERTRQLNAAKAIHKDDFKLTLEDYKTAYDERNDEWWKEMKGQLHVSHMRGKEKDSGIDRLHAMLGRIAARKAKGNGKTSSSSSAPLGGLYKDKTAELAAERKKYTSPSSEAVAPRIAASAATFSYPR